MTLPLRERCREQVRALTRLIDAGEGETWGSDASAPRDLLRGCERRLGQLDARHERDRRDLDIAWRQLDIVEPAWRLGLDPWPHLRYLSGVLGMIATTAPVPPAAVSDDDDCEGLGDRA